MKLLAKTPEERYQTAAGAASDLRRCLAEWETQDRIDEFLLGKQDKPDRLLIPEKLYGRESEVAALLAAFDRVFSWDDFNWLRQLWPRTLLVKGIMRPDDAERSIAAGADGVILSNHGGRQLDAAVSPLDVLAESRARISAPILVDSGYRRGSDIVKSLALGANAVLLGRAPLYGLAATGEAGADHVLHLLKDEVDRTLAQIGCPSVSQLSPDYVVADGQMPTSKKYLDDFTLNDVISPRGTAPSATGTSEEVQHERS